MAMSSSSSSFHSAELLRHYERMHLIPSEPLLPLEEAAAAAAAGDAVVHGNSRSLAAAAIANPASREGAVAEELVCVKLKPRGGVEFRRRAPPPRQDQGHSGRLNAVAAAAAAASSKPDGPGAPAEGSGGDGGAIHPVASS